MRVYWTRTACQRLSEINAYIASDSPGRARRWVESVLDEVDLLEAVPDLGTEIPDMEVGQLREMLFGNFRLVYRVDGQDIHILTVRLMPRVGDAPEVPGGGDEFPNG